MNQRNIIIIISVIWGFGLACILKYLFQNGETIIIKIPQLDKNNCIKNNKESI